MTPSEMENQVGLFLSFPKGEKGIQTVNSMKSYVKKILPENVKVQTTYTGKRLNSCFKTKDKTKFGHQHNIIYLSGQLYGRISWTYNRKSQRSQ